MDQRAHNTQKKLRKNAERKKMQSRKNYRKKVATNKKINLNQYNIKAYRDE